MAPPKGSDKVADVLAKFRQEQIKAAKVQQDAAKQRQERLKKIQSGGKQVLVLSNARYSSNTLFRNTLSIPAAGVSKKPTAPRQPRSRTAKITTSSGQQPSEGPSDSAKVSDWRSARAVAARPILPLGMRQKQVLDFLRQQEGPVTQSEISKATGLDLSADADLHGVLAANPKVAVDEGQGTWTYQPEANVRDKAQLLEYVRHSAAPVATSELSDAYRTVMADVAALKAEGLVLGLHSYDPEVNCEVLYPIDLQMEVGKADEDVRALWMATAIPEDDEDMATELRKVGLEPVPRKAPRIRASGEKKKRRKQRKATRLRAVTNVHLMHLLEGEGPSAIDALPPPAD
jgi:hypothetical protein